MGVQTAMGDFVVSGDEAAAIDKQKSKFFSAESNTTKKLTFTTEPMDDLESPDGKCVTGRLVKAMVPVFVNGKPTNEKEETIVRQMVIDSEDGKPCRKIWRIRSKKMRELFKHYTDNHLLDKKLFILEVKGELKAAQYFLTALDKPAQ